MLQELEPGWDTWGCSSGEGSRDSSEPLPVPKGAPRELERDWGQKTGVTRQWGMTPRDKNNNKIRQKFQVGDIQLEKLNDSHANKICLNSLLHDAGHWLQHEKKGRDEIIHNEMGAWKAAKSSSISVAPSA